MNQEDKMMIVVIMLFILIIAFGVYDYFQQKNIKEKSLACKDYYCCIHKSKMVYSPLCYEKFVRGEG